MRRFEWWSAAALADSLRLAFLLGLYDAGNDNGDEKARTPPRSTRSTSSGRRTAEGGST